MMTFATAGRPEPEEPQQNTTERGEFMPGYVHQASRDGLILHGSLFEKAAP